MFVCGKCEDSGDFVTEYVIIYMSVFNSICESMHIMFLVVEWVLTTKFRS